MSSILTFDGTFSSVPAISGSGRSGADVPISEKLTIGETLSLAGLVLTDDNPKSIPITTIPGFENGASAIVVRSTGGKVRLRITTTDGSTQAVPADPLAILISNGAPITALDLTRPAGVQVTLDGALYAKGS